MNLKQAKELVRSRLSDKRYEHTINVKKMAVKLAKHYGADEEQAALAALLHDAAKEISKDEMCAIMQAHPEYAEGGEARPTPVWHGVCASILARTEWGVTDEAVLSAIACHTAGKPATRIFWPTVHRMGKTLKNRCRGRAAKPIADSAGRCYTMTYDRFLQRTAFFCSTVKAEGA